MFLPDDYELESIELMGVFRGVTILVQSLGPNGPKSRGPVKWWMTVKDCWWVTDMVSSTPVPCVS